MRCLLSRWQRAQYPGATFSSNGYLTSPAINRRHGDSGGCWNDLFNSLTRRLTWNVLCPRSKLRSVGQIVFCSVYKAGKPSLVCSSMFVLPKLQLQICMEVCTVLTAFISLYSSPGSNKSADFLGGICLNCLKLRNGAHTVNAIQQLLKRQQIFLSEVLLTFFLTIHSERRRRRQAREKKKNRKKWKKKKHRHPSVKCATSVRKHSQRERGGGDQLLLTENAARYT